MREIKFRAWEIKGRGFIAGFNMVNYHSYYNKGLKPSIYRYSSEWEYGEYILEQFTGLKDKNGKEICEGDILEFDRKEWGGGNNIFVVRYDEIEGAWSTGGGTNSECCKWKTVIGNIHDNPELLKEQ